MLLDTPSLTIRFEPQENWLWVHWRGAHDAASVFQDCNRLLECAQQCGCTKILNDSSEAYGEWWQAAEWIGQEFLPQLASAGVQAVAWVNAMDWPSRHAVASTMQYARGLTIRTFDFDELEAAQQWLYTVPV
ncbi:SpoIIAA family protein [Hymenobacter metallilatus]|uniref:STAS/SEC14 domain-containing protein n=1 Tax=Hymenobacter metallilatus TaxID=2493666 RepID=A0A428JC86_9BACT|nr:STAS/SEC14 domain-containing protein [Hymenobacter metallilatus]RSK29612.1 STAS/SEC14 domain-containing protein [Hymenobacter metallilatus]